LLPAARRVRDGLRAAGAVRRNARLRRAGAPDGLPIPPTRLILLVTASPDVGWYLESGRHAAASIRSSLARNGVDVTRLRSILDFGCGCGRVVRHWRGLPGEVSGCDLNPRLVAWCRRRLGFARFESNRLTPPLAYRDGQFDLVYALSVFTHLPAELQRPWIQELARVVAPGGHLLITTHGARYLPELTPAERHEFEAGHLVVRREDSAGSNLCGAYHPTAYVESTLARGFQVVEFLPEGAAGNPHQDLYLLRKP
jgi:SAM-dependent methyltransferase